MKEKNSCVKGCRWYYLLHWYLNTVAVWHTQSFWKLIPDKDTNGSCSHVLSRVSFALDSVIVCWAIEWKPKSESNKKPSPRLVAQGVVNVLDGNEVVESRYEYIESVGDVVGG